MTTETADTVSQVGAIHAAMAQAMGEIQHVAKSKTNLMQKYQFRGYDDVYLACRAILSKLGIYVTHRILSHEFLTREVKRSNGNAGIDTVFHGLFSVRFTAHDGSFCVTETIGEAVDSGDKAANKAMSMAMKYALVDTFLIPTEEPRDTENDEADRMTDKQRDQIKGLAKAIGLIGDAFTAAALEACGKADPDTYTKEDAEKLLAALETRAKTTAKPSQNGAKQ